MSDNSKTKFEQLRAFFLGLESSGKEEKLMEEAPVEQEAAPAEEAPKPTYVTVEQFASMKDEVESFKNDITEMLSKLTEMINSTEKNKVPQEMSAQVEEVVEEKAEEEVELSAQGGEPIVHDPEGLVSQRVKTKLAAGRKMTTEDIVFNALAEAGVWNK